MNMTTKNTILAVSSSISPPNCSYMYPGGYQNGCDESHYRDEDAQNAQTFTFHRIFTLLKHNGQDRRPIKEPQRRGK